MTDTKELNKEIEKWVKEQSDEDDDDIPPLESVTVNDDGTVRLPPSLPSLSFYRVPPMASYEFHG